MIITRHGLEFFKVQFGDIVLAFNPPSKDSEYKPSRFGADVALQTMHHKDFNGGDLLTAGDKEPFVIDGPGEYEVQGVFVKGFESKSTYGGSEMRNTIYVAELEETKLCFLGALDTKELSPEASEELDSINVLFVPIGGDGVLTTAEAYNLAVKLEPNVIIPMHYKDEKSTELTSFLKEEGDTKKKPMEKLTMRKSDVLNKENEIIVLSLQ